MEASLEALSKVQAAGATLLEKVATGSSIDEVLRSVVDSVESLVPTCRCSVMLLDDAGQRLFVTVAPSLPEEYNRGIDGLRIGPTVGSCGAAAATGARVVIDDVMTHANWTEFRDLATRAGIRASWSQPILSSKARVIGTFALYYPQPHTPTPMELQFIENTARLVALAIELERATKRRYETERQLRVILDVDPHVIFSKNRDGTFLLVNRALAALYGLTVDEVVGRRQQDLHADVQQRETMLASDRRIIDSGTPHVLPRQPFTCADGSTRVFRTIKIPYTDPGIQDTAVLGVATDITELERAEQSLRESEQSFRQLAENIREVFWLTEWNPRSVLYVSPAYETIWGQTCQSLYDDPRSWAHSVHPDDRKRVERVFDEETERGRYEVEYRIVRPDGEVRWIYDRAFPILGGDGVVVRVAGISEDITQRKQAEEELRSALGAKLRDLESELMLAEEQERRRVASDLHDGLGQTLALAEMKITQLNPQLPAALRGALAEIRALVEEADRATRSLTFRLSPPILHHLGFVAALDWLAEHIAKTYGVPVELRVEGTPEELDDRVRLLLFRAVRELLINVAKHAKAKQAVVTVDQPGGMLRVRVRDDGVAFDPAVVGHSGSGLASIRQRLARLGGSTTIDSSPALGTSVTLVVPLRSSLPGNGGERLP